MLVPSLIGEIRKSVDDYSSELFSLKLKDVNIRKSVCNLDDVIGMVQTSTQIQEQKAEALEAFSQKTEEFTAEAARIDEDAAAVVVGICVATCGWLPVAVAAFVGGLVGVGGQLISDVIFWAVTGEWESSLEDYAGALLGGAVGGLLMLHPGNITLACLMDGMVSTLFGESLKNLTGRSNKTNAEIWSETLISAGISGLLGKGCEKLSKGAAKSISSAFPSLKRLSGRGSYGAAYQMVLTKLKNNTCKNISLKTLRNGFISGMWEGLFGIFFGELFKNSVDQIRAAA